MKEHTVIVKWRAGLHARRAVDLVKVSNKFQSSIIVKKGEVEADAKSIISIMTLEASYKSSLSIVVDGKDEKEAIKALVGVFNNINE
ncbi:MAG: HPr family phosphocarrier protein [Spirochaetes bacterium]|nr:HPr family phosphocarrier protein [Spirochaetota bacterium]